MSIVEIHLTQEGKTSFKFIPGKTQTWIADSDMEALSLGLILGRLPNTTFVEIVRAQFPETESKVICETK